jgi:hypothetical protein
MRQDGQLDYVLTFRLRFKTNAANSVAIMKSIRMKCEENSGIIDEVAVLDVACTPTLSVTLT